MNPWTLELGLFQDIMVIMFYLTPKPDFPVWWANNSGSTHEPMWPLLILVNQRGNVLYYCYFAGLMLSSKWKKNPTTLYSRAVTFYSKFECGGKSSYSNFKAAVGRIQEWIENLKECNFQVFPLLLRCDLSYVLLSGHRHSFSKYD